MIEPPSFRSGNAFCTVNSGPLTLMLNSFVEMLFSDGAERNKFANASVGENNIESPLHLGDGLVEPI
jgi:hypothetical protein